MSARRPARLFRSAAYRVFYGLPKPVRRKLVRLVAPTYTVGAVVLLYSQDGERLLMLRQPPGNGWGLPAGLLDRGERPEAAARRELREETGIALSAEQLRPASPEAVVHVNGRWVDVVFTARVEPEAVALRVDGAEVWEAEWQPRSALPEVTRAAARLLAHYGLGPYASEPASVYKD